MRANQASHATYYGRPGSGKSTLLAADTLDCPLPAIWIDPLAEHSGRPRDRLIRPVGSMSETVKRCARDAWERGDCQLVIDEADMAWLGDTVPQEIIHIARYGRHKNITMRLLARRPPAIPPELAAMSHDLKTFRQTHPRDLQYFHSLGLDPDLLRNTPEHSYWHCGGGLDDWHLHDAPLTPCSK